MSSILFLEDKRYVNLDNGDIYMGGTKQDHLPHKHIQLLKLLVSQNNVYHSSEEIYNRLEIDRINPTISEIRTAICDCKIGKGRSVSGRGFKDTWKYINNETNLGYKFNSKYRIVELLETAPNNIEPLTSKNNFVEEPKLIDKIFGAFEEGSKIVFLSGISGSGKSELARSFCPKYKDTFYSVLHFALTPEGNGSFEDLLAENDKFFGDSGLDRTQKLKARKDVIKKLGKESLIIIDNLNNDKNLAFLNDIHDIFGTRPTGAAKIIITSTLSGNTFADYLHYDCKVIEIEKERDKKQLAYDILARKAGISESENENIKAIVKAIGYHPLCSAIIGAQVKEYDLDLAYLRGLFDCDFKKALLSGESVLFRKDDINADFKPYEILKYIFKNVSKNLNEMERQVLGAYLLLPKSHHKLEVLSELVGDIKGRRSRAKGAIRILYRKCLIEIDKDGTVILHPLLEQLYQDHEFFNNGMTVAELSNEFRIHLLNNYFVSEYNDEKNKLSGVFFDRKYTFFDEQGNTGYVLKGMYSKLLDFSSCIRTKNAGWVLANKRKKDDFCSEEISELVESININQTELGLKDRIDEEILYDMIDSQKNNALYFVVEYKKGLSVFLYDYNNQKEYCVINCSEQIEEQNRYFDKNNTSAQAGVPIKSVFVGSFGDHLPKVFIIPEDICGIKTKQIYRKTEDAFKKENNEMKYLLIPKTVETIGDGSFRECFNLRCIVFGSGKNINIEAHSFFRCIELKYVFLPLYPCRLGRCAFEYSNIGEIVVQKGTVARIFYDMSFVIALNNMLVDGKFYQTKDSGNISCDEKIKYDILETVKKIMDKSYEPSDEEIDEIFYRVISGASNELSDDVLIRDMDKLLEEKYKAKFNETRVYEGFEYDINEIFENWLSLNDVYDKTGTKLLDWKDFFIRLAKSVKETQNLIYTSPHKETVKMNVNFGNTILFDNITNEVLILSIFPENIQVNLLEYYKIIRRIETPFYPREKTIFIAETPYDQMLEDSIHAFRVLFLCEERSRIYASEGNYLKSNEYRRFAESFLQERPDLFQDFEEDENEYCEQKDTSE